MPIAISDAHAPIIIVTVTGDLTDKEYAEHLPALGALTTGRDRPYAFVYDGTDLVSMAPSQRHMQSKWINEHKTLIRRYNCGSAFVFPSVYQRGILTAVHWIAPPPYQHIVCARRHEGIKWCIEQLRLRGVALPAGVDHYRSW